MGKHNYFINTSVAVCCGTLIDVDMPGDKRTLDLSDFSIGVSKITSLGDACLNKLTLLENLILPPSIEHLSPRSFTYLKNLNLVKVVDFCISHDEYERFKHFFTYIGSDSYSIDFECSKMGNGSLGEIYNALSNQLFRIPQSESSVYIEDYGFIFKISKDDFFSKSAFFRTRKITVPGSDAIHKSENDIIMEMISRNNLGYTSKEAESHGELIIKTNCLPSLNGCISMTCDNDSIISDGSHLLTISFEHVLAYFPSLIHVSFNSGDYWVYRRCILSEGTYFPVVMAIYDRNGVVTNDQIIRGVYDKYKMLSIV